MLFRSCSRDRSSTCSILSSSSTSAIQVSPSRCSSSGSPFDRFLGEVSDSEVASKPFKYLGYRGFVSHLVQSDDVILRRFDHLHVRLLLYLQDQIVQLETELAELDQLHAEGRPELVHNGTFRKEHEKKRTEVMESLRGLLEENDGLLLRYVALKAQQKPSNRTVSRVKKWLQTHNFAKKGCWIERNDGSKCGRGPIADEEVKFLDQRADLVAVIACGRGSQTGFASKLVHLCRS